MPLFTVLPGAEVGTKSPDLVAILPLSLSPLPEKWLAGARNFTGRGVRGLCRYQCPSGESSPRRGEGARSAKYNRAAPSPGLKNRLSQPRVILVPLNGSILKLIRLAIALAITIILSSSLTSHAAEPVRVLVWDEQQPEQSVGYGDQFLGEAIASYLQQQPGITVRTAKLDDPDQGLNALGSADVLIYWSHRRVKEQDDSRTEAIVQQVLDGKLSLIALHSAHWAKPFVRLMQERAKTDAIQQLPEAERASSKWEYVNDQPYYRLIKADSRLTPFVRRRATQWCFSFDDLPQCVFPTYRADGAPSHVTTLLPDHPIAAGLPKHWDIPQTEMYGEPFHVPAPDEVVFEERWDKGERFRSGCVWKVGKGRVFYFRPGHETYPIYKQAEPLKVLENAVRWLAPENAL